MNFQRRGSDDDEIRIDVTNLVDVLLLLLIFFMVFSTFKQQTQLSVDLPEAASGDNVPQAPPLEVVVSRSGDYFVNGEPLGKASLDQLVAALRRGTADARKLPRVLVSADRAASHESVMRVMEAARQGGFVNLGFTAQASQ